MSSHRSHLADPRFSKLQQLLQSLEGELGPIPNEDGVRVHAAVSLILREGKELEVLLIKRAEIEGDPWSGQMALPGGRKDASDSSLLQTAMRETEEEVGLSLESEAVPLGRLEPTIPATHRLPPITIFPFVFRVPQEAKARAASREVVRVVERVVARVVVRVVARVARTIMAVSPGSSERQSFRFSVVLSCPSRHRGRCGPRHHERQ